MFRIVLSTSLLAFGLMLPPAPVRAEDPSARVVSQQRQVLVPARPSDAEPHPASALAAQDWASMVVALAQAQDWGPAMWVAPIGVRSFAHEAVWTQPDFQQAWHATLVAQANRGWRVGDNGASLWQLAAGEDPLRPSLGLVRQDDDSWWVVLAEPDAVDGVPTVPWPCPADGCPVSFHVRTPANQGPSAWTVTPEWTDQLQSITLRHPNGRQMTNPTRVLGFPLRSSLVPAGATWWSVVLPGHAAPARWNMSFLAAICAAHGLSCPTGSPAGG